MECIGKSITFNQLLTDLCNDEYAYKKIERPFQDIYSVKFYSPLEKELDEHTLYISGQSSWCRPCLSDTFINMIYFGDNDHPYSWCNNLVIYKDIPENRLCVENIQNYFSDKDSILEQNMKLVSAMFKNRGIKYFVQAASAIFGNPIVIIQSSMNVAAYDFSLLLRKWKDEGIEKTERQRRQSQILLELQELVTELDDQKKKSGRYYEHCRYSESIGYNLLIQKIQINDLNVATMIIIEAFNNQLDMDISALQTFGGLVSQELQKVSYYIDNVGDKRAVFLVDLLNEIYPNKSIVDRRLASIDYQLKDNFYIIVLRYIREADHDINSLLLSMRRIIMGNIFAVYQKQIVILVNINHELEPEGYFMDSLKEMANQSQLIIGVSQQFHDILEIRRYYDQAIKALSYGETMLNANQKHPFYYFQDYILIEMLDICRKNENLIDFCNPKVLKLLKFDKQYGTDHMTTLYTFMEQSMNIRKTAQAMFIHKNTLIYRIEKIKEILNYDFENSWENFTIYLSFRIVMFIGEFQPEWRKLAESEHKERFKSAGERKNSDLPAADGE